MTLHSVQAYIRGVLEGTIPVGALLRLAVERHVRDLEDGSVRGVHFDRAKAEHVTQFFGFLRHSKGEWAGKPFVLEPWEQFLLWDLFGWIRADGTRRFRTAYVECPKKNGKTTLLAGIGLYLLVSDGEPGAEIYSAATKRDQALLAHREATEMVRKSPELRRLIQTTKNNLSIKQTASKYEPLGADADTMDGLNPHGALIDELHAHKTSDVVDVLETAMGARRQPLQFEITTAGFDRQSICWQHHEYSRQVLEGTLQDDSWFAFISCADEKDDWTDPRVWAKANPNYGISVKHDHLASMVEQARHMPAKQNVFKRFRLNLWTQQSDRWIDQELWNENAGVVVEENLRGCLCYGGLDLSSVSDITAWVMVFPRESDPEALDVVARFWCPQARLEDDGNRYRAQYQAWAQRGLLQATPGDAVDYATVKKRILEDVATFYMDSVNVDRLFQGYQLSQELADEGLEVYGMGQGFISMAAPMKEFERRLLTKKIHHGGNPVLAWMADNMSVEQDAAGNVKPDKSESQGKIDGIVALVMALDRAMRAPKPKKSVYEDRGLISA